jgi:hypothetical protein
VPINFWVRFCGPDLREADWCEPGVDEPDLRERDKLYNSFCNGAR